MSLSKGIQAEVGKKKIDFPSNDPAPEMYEAIKDFAIDDIRVALDTDDKRIRDERLKPIYEKVHEKFDEIYPDEIEKIDDCLYKTQKFVVRRWLLDDGKRVDGRGIDEIRPLAAEVGLLPTSPRLGSVHQRPNSGSDHRHPRPRQRRSDS